MQITNWRERFYFMQKQLGVKVTFNTTDLNEYLKTSEFVLSCKRAIPSAQTFDTISLDIALALPETYEYTFKFEHEGENYDFSFKGGRSKLISYDYSDKAANALIAYFPTITISKDGQLVFKHKDTIKVNIDFNFSLLLNVCILMGRLIMKEVSLNLEKIAILLKLNSKIVILV
jgi:hypothetical protein